MTVVEAEPAGTSRQEGSEAAVDALPWGDGADPTDLGVIERMRQQRLRARILGEPEPPATVGRFSILRKLGAGGMGAVYAAYDEELDREVALKFLHPAQATDDHAIHRLLREAQALAKLSHPNLVAVYDVGRFEDQVYLAMELVPGVTMRQWADDTARSWREILGRWLEVGRALVVVHDSGLVHRDIKPDNVLVGEDGRARLVDFGLARGRAAQQHEGLGSGVDTSGDSTASGRGSRLDERVTQTRAVVGTPAYMAPEVRMGGPAVESSDQYSLCVSIYHSIYGERPPRPTERGELVDVPEPSPVPAVIRRVLSRGLRLEESERYPSAQELVAALERVLGRRRRWVLAGTTGAALVLAGGVGGVLARATEAEPHAADPCAAVADDLHDTWDHARRGAVIDAIEATGLPYAPTLAPRFAADLDGYARAWLDARTRVCEAHRVHHTQSDALFDRRMACLDRQRVPLEALVDAALEVDVVRAPKLPLALAELTAPEDCEGSALVESAVAAPPADRVDAVNELRGALEAVRVTARLVGPKTVLDEAQRLRDRAESLGYAPLLAEVEQALGHLYYLAENPLAARHLLRAETLAETEGDDLLKESVLAEQARLAVHVGGDVSQARAAWERNLATLRRIGEPAQRVARSMQTLAVLQLSEGDHAAAEATHRKEIEAWGALGDRFTSTRAVAWRSLGNVLIRRGASDQALRAFDRAASLEASFGIPVLGKAVGVRIGKAEHMRGLALVGEGQLDRASTLLHRALHKTEDAYGADSIAAGRVREALAVLASERGQLDVSVEHAQAADAIYRRWLGEEHLFRRSVLSILGTVAFYREDAGGAVWAFEQALRIQQRSLPPDHLDLALAHSNLGEALVLAGRDDEAIASLEVALATMQRSLEPGDDDLSYPLHGLAEAYLRKGQRQQAREHAEAALKIREHGNSRVERARTRWLLARCLPQLERDRAEALAREALAAFTELGEDFADDVAAIEAFLGT